MNPALACRSDFSIGESILSPKLLVETAKDLGLGVVALTDTMTVTALIDFSEKAKEAAIRPVIGCRLRMSDEPTWRPMQGQKKKHMPRYWHVTVYPRTELGMQAVYRLLSLANSNERFYYESKLGWEDLYAELSGDMIVVLGEGASLLEHPEVETIAFEMKNRTPHVFAPLIPIDTPYWTRCNAITADLVNKLNIEPVTIRPALYEKDQADAQEIMAAIANGHKVTDGWFRARFNRDMNLLSEGEFVKAVKAAAERLKTCYPSSAPGWKRAVENTDRIVELIDYEWEKLPVTLPRMAPDEFQAVVEACKLGWKERFTKPVFGHVPDKDDLDAAYRKRLAYELSILKKLNFSSYFLLVQKIVRWSKSNGILVGPGRGSVGGSLVAYLMGITDVDPIRFGLIFERFINPERIDLPDADLDFMASRCKEVEDFLVMEYGRDHVAGVAAIGTLASASAIRDVGKALGIPEREYSISKFVPKKHGQNVPLPECREEVPEINAFADKYAFQWDIMERLAGNTRSLGRHAAGIVVSACPMIERAVLERRRDGAVISFDKDQIEKQGLVKIDVLALNTLDVMSLALSYVEEKTGSRPDLWAIPLDDRKALDSFADGKTTGVFQFASGGMKKLLRDLGAGDPITFEDITAATALYRPGPMESGMMDSYAQRKQGLERVDYDHELMQSILEETYGVMIYQEQIMKISQVVAGYTGPEADKLRKIMGKKKPEEMKKQKDKFIQGCLANIYEVTLDNGQTVQLHDTGKYEVEEGGLYSLDEIEKLNLSIVLPLKHVV